MSTLYRDYLSPAILSRLSRLDLIAKYVVEGYITGLHKSPYHGFSTEFAEHRQYMAGDSLRFLDWKVYGRTNRMYVKRFEEETNLKSYLLLNISGSMGEIRAEDEESSGDKLGKLEYGCYLAACLAHLMLRQRDSVGLVTFNDGMLRYIPPRHGSRHLHALMSELESVSPNGNTNISATFNELAQRIVRRGLIIVISDFLDDDTEQVLRALKYFRHKKHEVIIFHILDPAELEFPFDGTTIFRDMETGEQLLAEDARELRSGFLEDMDNLKTRLMNGCRANSVDYVQMNTSTTAPYYSALSLYLSKRKRRL